MIKDRKGAHKLAVLNPYKSVVQTFNIKKEGYLTNIDALELGKLSMQLGAGRTDLTSKIDYGAGIIVKKNIGDYVNKGDILMTLYTNKNLKASIMNTPVFEIKKTKPDTPKLIYDIIR